jgi:phosphoglycolate phosphatase-like HAD superfamily hydrolase
MPFWVGLSAASGHPKVEVRMNCILFDFDGPIVDLFDSRSGRRVSHSIIDVARKFGVTDRADSSHFIAVWKRERAAVFAAGGDLAAFDQQVHQAIERHELDMVRNVGPDPSSIKMLATAHHLSGGVAIVSNNSPKAVSLWLSKYELVHLVDCISGRRAESSFECLKPRPDLINRAIASLGCGPDNAIFIGDTEADYLSSRAAGVRFIALTTSHSVFGQAHASSIRSLSSRAAVSRYLEAILT